MLQRIVVFAPTLEQLLLKWCEDRHYACLICRSSAEVLPAALTPGVRLIVATHDLETPARPSVCIRLRDAGVTVPVLCVYPNTTSIDTRYCDGTLALGLATFERSFGVQLTETLRSDVAGGISRRLHCGPLVLDPTSGNVLLDGALLCLTPAQYALTHCLLQSRGEVLSATELHNRVCGSHSQDGAGIRRLVTELRRRLGTHRNLVQTVHGRGYTMRASQAVTETAAPNSAELARTCAGD